MQAAGPLASYVLAVAFGGPAFLADRLGMGHPRLRPGVAGGGQYRAGDLQPPARLSPWMGALPGHPLALYRDLVSAPPRIAASYATHGHGHPAHRRGALGADDGGYVHGEDRPAHQRGVVHLHRLLPLLAATAGYRQARARSRISHLEVGGAYSARRVAADLPPPGGGPQYHGQQPEWAHVPVLKQGRL